MSEQWKRITRSIVLNGTKLIPLSKGRFAIVDEADYERLSKWKWYYNSHYARRGYRKDGKMVFVLMHRVIANTPEGFETDHINRNKLDNRRANLRVCSHSLNQLNKDKQRNNSSGFKGVYFHKRINKFAAQIARRVSGKRITHFLGYFPTPDDAHKAYIEAQDKRVKELCST